MPPHNDPLLSPEVSFEINNLAVSRDYISRNEISFSQFYFDPADTPSSSLRWVSCKTCNMYMVIDKQSVPELPFQCIKCSEIDRLNGVIYSLTGTIWKQQEHIINLRDIKTLENELDSTLNEITDGIAAMNLNTSTSDQTHGTTTADQ